MTRATTVDAMLQQQSKQEARSLSLARELAKYEALVADFAAGKIGRDDIERECTRVASGSLRRIRLVYVLMGKISSEAQARWMRDVCRGTRDEYGI